jgi:pimeloyl-ACP methyl ester carboxylesterase
MTTSRSLHHFSLPISLLVLLNVSFAATRVAPTPETADKPAEFQHAFLLHLPGVAGELSIDRDLIHGLKAGGYGGPTEIYDWTESDPGLSALWSRRRNDKEAQRIADKIIQIAKDDPAVRITITAHSGGTGLAVWALERLPEDVHVQTLILLSSALSPGYDLSRALRHVRGNAYAFNSEYDSIVLGAGTRAFGTIDGVRSEAAGKIGFIMPDRGDARQYAKLVQVPFDRAWMKYGNLGDHIGMLSPEFSQRFLAPLVRAGLGMSTTQPAATQPSH